MNDKPFLNEPGFETAPSHVVHQYNESIRHEVIRVAVLGMVTPTSAIHLSLPQQLRDVMIGLFPSFLESYLASCSNNLHRDGTVNSFHIFIDYIKFCCLSSCLILFQNDDLFAAYI